MWSKEEIDILMSNIERYLKVSYSLFFCFTNLFTANCKNIKAAYYMYLGVF